VILSSQFTGTSDNASSSALQAAKKIFRNAEMFMEQKINHESDDSVQSSSELISNIVWSITTIVA
jgi:hypothetical protein